MPTKHPKATTSQQLDDARSLVRELEDQQAREALEGRPPLPEGWTWLEDDSRGPRAEKGEYRLEMDFQEGGVLVIDDTDCTELTITTAAVCAFVDYLRQIGMAPPAHRPKVETSAPSLAQRVKGWQPA